MKFNVNHPIIFVLVGIIVALVIAQSVYFLVKAIKRAKELGITKETIKNPIKKPDIKISIVIKIFCIFLFFI